MMCSKQTLVWFIQIFLILRTMADIEFSEIEEKKNILTLTNKSMGYIPIEEILKRVNFSRMDKTTERDLQTSRKKETPEIRINTMKILLTGSNEEISSIPYKTLMLNLGLIDSSMLSQRKRSLIWEIITSNVLIENMDAMFLRETNGLCYDTPENELVRFNVRKWDVIDFFGTSKFLKRRPAAILAYIIKKTYGSVLENSFYINKLKGLICGFSESDLTNISSSVFVNIKQTVFENIWPCTIEQVKVLLNNAKRADTYGPLEVWTNEIFRKLALIVTIIKPKEFRKFNRAVFKGLTIAILDLISNEQLAQFTDEQVSNLEENVLVSYDLRMNNIRLMEEFSENGSENLRDESVVYLYASVVCFLFFQN